MLRAARSQSRSSQRETYKWSLRDSNTFFHSGMSSLSIGSCVATSMMLTCSPSRLSSLALCTCLASSSATCSVDPSGFIKSLIFAEAVPCVAGRGTPPAALTICASSRPDSSRMHALYGSRREECVQITGAMQATPTLRTSGDLDWARVTATSSHRPGACSESAPTRSSSLHRHTSRRALTSHHSWSSTSCSSCGSSGRTTSWYSRAMLLSMVRAEARREGDGSVRPSTA
mmetsp:Transcript_8952/g.20590  ORF Transcript_8952/g.20590 Transcript_8952/m.20590 type:complete len:230 (-) Transcript_8952:1519-2208(-)